MPVSLKVMIAVIKNAISTDMMNANSSRLYFLGTFISISYNMAFK